MSRARMSGSSNMKVGVFIFALLFAGLALPAVHAATTTTSSTTTTSQTDTLVCSPARQTLGQNVTCTSTVVIEAGNSATLSFQNNSLDGGYLMLAPASCNGAQVNPTEIACSVSLECQGPADTVTVIATYGIEYTATTNVVCLAAGTTSLSSSATSTSSSSTVPEFPQGALAALLFAALVVTAAVSSRRYPAISAR